MYLTYEPGKKPFVHNSVRPDFATGKSDPVMATTGQTPDPAWFYGFYERYAGMLYSVLTDVCKSSAGAELALLHTFEELNKNSPAWQCRQVNAIALVKLAIHTARQLHLVKEPVCITCFRPYTLLHYLLCENGSLESHCKRSGLERAEVVKQLHVEFSRMSTLNQAGFSRGV